MGSDLWNIVLNVVASFIYAGIISWWEGWRQSQAQLAPAAPPRKPPTARASPMPASVSEPDERRRRNIAALDSAAFRFIFYLVTFGTLYLSTSLPPLFKTLFAKTPVMLSDARFVGEFLPDIVIGKQNFQFAFFVAAALLYWPVLAIAEFLASLAAPAIDAFKPVTPKIRMATAMLFFQLLCAPIAAASIFLFFEKSFAQSLTTVGVVLVLALVFIMSQAGPRR